MFATVERARERFAGLINARAEEIAITKNMSEGLNIIAAALPWRAGDNVVLCRQLEHPNNIFPWANLHGASASRSATCPPTTAGLWTRT